MIIFTQHSKVRMWQRKISEKEVKLTIENPEKVEETFKERIKVERKIGNKRLVVIYKTIERNTIIITCYWKKEG
ncbi:MAG: DUF4258 domain-containing protein [Candidatus Omnitrophica bacterium]|nr:DUF4258 domain-containing protein [Candidatus Omnitrophota bacterium]